MKGKQIQVADSPQFDDGVPVPNNGAGRQSAGSVRSDLTRLLLQMRVGQSFLVESAGLTAKQAKSAVSQRNARLKDRGRWLVRQAVDGWRVFRVDPELYPAPRGRRQPSVQAFNKATGEWEER